MRRGQGDQPTTTATNFPLMGIFILIVMGIATISVIIYNKWRNENE